MAGKVMPLKEAISKYVTDGCVLCQGGFSINRKPMAAAYEIIRQGIKDLHLVEIVPGPPSVLLTLAGCVSISESTWTGYEVYGHPYMWRQLVEQGPTAGFRWDEWPHYAIVLRFLAGWMGVPFVPTYTGKGSDEWNPEFDNLAPLRGRRRKVPQEKFVLAGDPFYGGEEVFLVPSVNPDVSIIHVSEASDDGTARITCCGDFDDFLHAAAAEHVIITCERIVSREYISRQPELNLIPSIYVDAVCEVPYGAHPCQCPGYYDVDPWFLREIVSLTQQGEKRPEIFKDWMAEWVYGVKDHTEYLEKLGLRRLNLLKADPGLGYKRDLPRRLDKLPAIDDLLSKPLESEAIGGGSNE